MGPRCRPPPWRAARLNDRLLTLHHPVRESGGPGWHSGKRALSPGSLHHKSRVTGERFPGLGVRNHVTPLWLCVRRLAGGRGLQAGGPSDLAWEQKAGEAVGHSSPGTRTQEVDRHETYILKSIFTVIYSTSSYRAPSMYQELS